MSSDRGENLFKVLAGRVSGLKGSKILFAGRDFCNVYMFEFIVELLCLLEPLVRESWEFPPVAQFSVGSPQQFKIIKRFLSLLLI